MTEQQEKDFEEKGFIILEDFLSPDELSRLLAASSPIRTFSRTT